MNTQANSRLPWRSISTALCLAASCICGSIDLAAENEPESPKLELRNLEPKSGEKQFLGRKVPEFILADSSGKQMALSDYSEKPVMVVFLMGKGCPIANLYLKELTALRERFQGKGLEVIGLHSNAGTTPAAIAKHIEEFTVTFPVLHDADARVADLLGATRTAEVFLLDRQRTIRYHGRVDDRFGYTYKREEPRRRDLKLAIEELLAKKDVTVGDTKPLGCLITRARRPGQESTVTYAKDISRIIQKRCLECHRPAMVGPFSLLSYDETLEWTDMIKEVVTERRMPPWHADPRYGHFSNNRRMPQEEVDTLVAWLDAGAPFGDKKDLPPPKEYVEGSAIDKPDFVFRLPEEVTVPADGVVPYLYFTVPTNFKEDVWIAQAEARPDNRAVVHHIIVSHRDPKAKGRRARRGGGVCGTAPGDPPVILPPGVAKKIPAGSELVFQMHYTPTGKVEQDRSEVGLVVYKGELPPRGISKSKGIMNLRFKIPAGDPDYEVKSSYTFERDALLLTLMPHMHLRGKDFQYRATYPDGRSEILLSVPGYDFNWQNKYRFATPLSAPAGTRIDCVAHFDNSASNPANPDPTQPVTWGDQTWEEMMIGWISYMWTTTEQTASSASAGDWTTATS